MTGHQIKAEDLGHRSSAKIISNSQIKPHKSRGQIEASQSRSGHGDGFKGGFIDTDGQSSDEKASGFLKGTGHFSVDSLHFGDEDQLDKDF